MIHWLDERMSKWITNGWMNDLCFRVHDNLQANAVMQQAAVILQVEESMPRLRCFYDNQYIFKHCSPLAVACKDITTNPHYHRELGHINAQIKVCIKRIKVFFSLVIFNGSWQHFFVLQETLDQYLVLQRDTDTMRGNETMRSSK